MFVEELDNDFIQIEGKNDIVFPYRKVIIRKNQIGKIVSDCVKDATYRIGNEIKTISVCYTVNLMSLPIPEYDNEKWNIQFTYRDEIDANQLFRELLRTLTTKENKILAGIDVERQNKIIAMLMSLSISEYELLLQKIKEYISKENRTTKTVYATKPVPEQGITAVMVARGTIDSIISYQDGVEIGRRKYYYDRNGRNIA
jgi:hypothetical protein